MLDCSNRTIAGGLSLLALSLSLVEGGAVEQRIQLLMLGVWEKVVVGADGGCWGWDPPSSSVRRREELAVEKMGWWAVRWLLAVGGLGKN